MTPFENLRSAGVQLHPTSLSGGRLGGDAFAFVDWLQAAGQGWWQTLPLGPPDEHGSPYKAASAFAAWNGLLADPKARVTREERDAFREREAFWVEDWMAFAGGDDALDDQVRFDREWSELRAYAASKGVRLIGDIPIYVAPGSADHEAHPELFRDGVQAGVPPDAFSDLGQLWGNPLYDWRALSRRRYRWWVERARRVLQAFDVARIDHFRGLVAYWEVPADAEDARGGRWRRGPGRALFEAIERELGQLPFIAEDLGVITPPVRRLRDALGLPGMVIIQFGFDPSDPDGPHRLEHHRANSVVYTGTHDNNTLRGWWDDDASDAERDDVRATVDGLDEDAPEWALIDVAYSSPAQLAMIQAQDVLGLGSEARMNMPGTKGQSWKWRMERGALTGELAARLREATERAGRLPDQA